MGKREELIKKFYKYVSDKLASGEWPADHATKFMNGVHAAVAEFVFDDEKTPLDIEIDELKTPWFSPYQAPMDGTTVLAKYTDGVDPEYGVIYFAEGIWDTDFGEVRRPFVWTRIPK